MKGKNQISLTIGRYKPSSPIRQLLRSSTLVSLYQDEMICHCCVEVSEFLSDKLNVFVSPKATKFRGLRFAN